MAERKNTGARRGGNAAANLRASMENEQKAAELAQARTEAQMSEEMSRIGEELLRQMKGKKAKTKAQTIAERRPLQVSIHFTLEEKKHLEDCKFKLKLKGYNKASVEDIVHEAVLQWLDKNYDDPILEDELV